MSAYYENLAQDFTALGLDGIVEEPRNYSGLYSILRLAGQGLQQPEELVCDPSSRPQTFLGKIILNLLEDNGKFEDVDGYQCCSKSEQLLLQNMADYGRARRDQPVVVTSGNRAVGILKTDGDRTCYGLVHAPCAGLVTGSFSAAETHDMINPYDLRPSREPWKIEIDDIDPLLPVRPSLFTVPLAAKRHLPDDWGRGNVLRTSHAAIVRRADELLAKAVPITDASFL